MDDLKLYANSRAELERKLAVVIDASTSIGMELGYAKCAQAHLAKGKRTAGVELTPEVANEETTRGIKTLSMTETYKYLGVWQGVGHNDTKNDLANVTRVVTERTQQLCRSKLNGKNLVQAYNSEIVGALAYYFSSLSCTRSFVQRELEPMLKKLLKRFLIYYRTDSVDRLFIPRSQGGRGFRSVLDEYDSQVLSGYVYFATSDDPFIRAIWCLMQSNVEDRSRRNLYSEGSKILAACGIQGLTLEKERVLLKGTEVPRNDPKGTVAKYVKEQQGLRYVESLRAKKNFGKFYSLVEKRTGVWDWLSEGKLTPQQEALISVIQNRALKTRFYEKHILKINGISDRCRSCGAEAETVEHIINRCSTVSR